MRYYKLYYGVFSIVELKRGESIELFAQWVPFDSKDYRSHCDIFGFQALKARISFSEQLSVVDVETMVNLVNAYYDKTETKKQEES